jgi:hypothetical protein
MINEGPDLNAIEKATGKKVRPVSIQEAARQTPVPAEAARKITESRRAQDPKESPKDRNQDRNEKTPPDATLAPTDKGKESPKTDVGRPPQRPTPDSPSEKPTKSGRGKSGGKRQGKGKE